MYRIQTVNTSSNSIIQISTTAQTLEDCEGGGSVRKCVEFHSEILFSDSGISSIYSSSFDFDEIVEDRNDSDGEEWTEEDEEREQKIADANRRWEENIKLHNDKDVCKKSAKRVHFAEDLVCVYFISWNEVHRAARKGPWEQLAIDRARFTHRIASMSNIFEHILNPRHRENVWNVLHSQKRRDL
jgi:hypothetical protein